MAKRPEVIDKLKEIASRPGVTVPWDRITINRWKPDTCRCVIEQWFDDDAEPRSIGYAYILSTCPEHSVTGETLWNTINGENWRKNKVLAIIESLATLETRESTLWRFLGTRLSGTDERVLEVEVLGVNTSVRNSIQDAADIQFGTGAVEVK